MYKLEKTHINENLINKLIKEIYSVYPEQITKYKNGEKKYIGLFVGYIMKGMRGACDPGLAKILIENKLNNEL